MTAHRPKPTLTPEWVARFVAYHRKHGAWGAFHVSLDDGNWTCGAYRDMDPSDPRLTDAGEDMLDYFDALSPSQRRRLAAKCHEVWRAEYVARWEVE